MTTEITIPADSARAIAELAVDLKCAEMAFQRAIDALDRAEDVYPNTLETDRAAYLASQRAEDAARKLAVRFVQIDRFQNNMLGGFAAIHDDAKGWAENWDARADSLQKRADSYRAQISKALAA
jgi:hypothetical protein